MKQINLADRPLLSEKEVSEHGYLVQTRGFTLLHDFLAREETDLLKLTMEQAIEEFRPVPGVERSYLDRYQIHDLINRDINYGRLLEDPRLQQLIAPHLGRTLDHVRGDFIVDSAAWKQLRQPVARRLPPVSSGLHLQYGRDLGAGRL